MVLSRIPKVVAGTDVIVSFIIFGISYALASAVVLPGYLLIVWYDALQNSIFPTITQTGYDIGQVLFIYVLAVVAGTLARSFRRRFSIGDHNRTPLSDVAIPLAAVFTLFSLLALLISIPTLIMSGTVNPVGFALGALFLICSAGLLRYTTRYVGNQNAKAAEQSTG